LANALSHRWISIFPALGLGALVLATGLRKIRAPDYWWHLSTGRWIVEHGRVPDVDVFTYTVNGAPYLDAHWLFQLGLYAVQSLGGHEAVVVAKTFLIALLGGILAHIGWRRDRIFVTAFGVGLTILAANDRLLARPETTSFVLLAAIFALLERDTRCRDRWVFLVLPVQLLWVNSHGLYALGIALCGCYATAAAIRSLQDPESRLDLRRLVILTLCVVAMSFASPHFVAGALYPLEQLGMISPSGLSSGARFSIGELIPFWSSWMSVMNAVPVLLLACLAGASLVLNWRHDRARLQHALVFVSFFGLFTLANRNAAVFAIVAGPLLVVSTNQWLDRYPGIRRFQPVGEIFVAIALLLVSWDLARGSYWERLHGYHVPGLGYIDLFVAEGATDWLERESPPGPIAHSMVLGGYLNWRLHPRYEVMIDGRLEVYGPEMLSRLVLRDVASFQRLDRQYHFGSVALTSAFDSVELIAWLHAQPEWRLVQAEIRAVLFVRVDDATSEEWPEVDVDSRDFLPAPTSGHPIVRNAQARARARLLAALRSKSSNVRRP
jgi:hypothetical protein